MNLPSCSRPQPSPFALTKSSHSSILLSKEGGEHQNFLELLIRNSNSRTRKNSPIGLTKTGASMVGRMFAIETMDC